jgi:hypothetical protein
VHAIRSWRVEPQHYNNTKVIYVIQVRPELNKAKQHAKRLQGFYDYRCERQNGSVNFLQHALEYDKRATLRQPRFPPGPGFLVHCITNYPVLYKASTIGIQKRRSIIIFICQYASNEKQKNQVALTGIRTTDLWIAGPLLYQLLHFAPWITIILSSLCRWRVGGGYMLKIYFTDIFWIRYCMYTCMFNRTATTILLRQTSMVDDLLRCTKQN